MPDLSIELILESLLKLSSRSFIYTGLCHFTWTVYYWKGKQGTMSPPVRTAGPSTDMTSSRIPTRHYEICSRRVCWGLSSWILASWMGTCLEMSAALPLVFTYWHASKCSVTSFLERTQSIKKYVLLPIMFTLYIYKYVIISGHIHQFIMRKVDTVCYIYIY